jgi:small-conductance mechanosensitive channel
LHWNTANPLGPGADVKRNLTLLVIFGLLTALFWILHDQGVGLGMISPGHDLASLLGIIAAMLVGYEIVVLMIQVGVARRRGIPGEVRMLSGLVRFGIAIAGILLLLASFGQLKAVGTGFALFGGMLLGWSLQAPVSGIAAWALINVKRPFRVGDRILLPSLGLNGDVMDVGLMYTALNQVGGTIASEEAIGRQILIPNAMLFSQVVINYTAEMGIKDAAHFLDEVIVRITFDSDWDAAERMLLDAAREVTGEIIKETGQEPYIRSDFYDYGVYMRLRYMTLATDRPRITHELTKRIFRGFQRELRVDLAIPYVYSYRHTLPSERFRYPGEAEPVEEIEISEIDDPWALGDLTQPEDEGIRDLARHIESEGLLQPIVVQRQINGRYRVIAGTNRLRACKLLGWTRVPANLDRRGASPAA